MSSAGASSLRYSQPLLQHQSEAYRLRRQWAITEATEIFDHAWPALPLNDRFVLHHHPDTRLQVTAGPPGVALVGTAVSSSALGPAALRAELDGVASATEEERIEFLRRLTGIYVLIRFGTDRVTVYTDPAAMMQTFYRGNRAASTPALMGHLQRDTRVDKHYVFGDDDWYPGGLTPYRDVRVLLANHSLDLASGRSVRFWPTRDPAPIDPSDGPAILGDHLRTSAERVARTGPLLCSLTGGKDSRVNLAALRQVHSEVEFFTIAGSGIKPCDTAIPARLTEKVGIDHRFVENVPSPDWILELYDEMTCGLSIGGRRSVSGAAAAIAGSRYIHLNGNLGALTKSYFWPSPAPKTVSLAALSKEFSQRPPIVVKEVEEWLASVPEFHPTTIYNLMYLEQRGGRWMGIGETASNLFYDSFSLFASREVFEMINSLPTQTQYGGTLLVDIVAHLWPELLAVPYCRSRRNWSTYIPRSVKNRTKRAASLLTRRSA